MTEQQKLSNVLCGIAGEYFVAGELSRRGYIASLTLRNTRGVDIVVSNEDATRSVGVQVKTSQKTAPLWLLDKKVEKGADEEYAANLFFVFVNLPQSGQPKYYIVPLREVAEYARRRHETWLQTPGKHGVQHKDASMRKFEDREGKYLNRWDLLGLDG